MKEKRKKIYTKEDVAASLYEMGAPRGGVVLVHSSLRSVGRVEGGAEALLDALIEYFTADGGALAIPTHTWMNLDKEITLDLSDPKTCLGALPDIAAADPRGVRTKNPTHSVVLFGDGDRIRGLAEGELGVGTPTSPDSFYGKLYRAGGHILLIGVGQERNTYLHAVEEMLGIPDRMGGEPHTVRVKDTDGSITESRLTLFNASFSDDVSLRFPKLEEAFRYHRIITDGYIGNAHCRLMSAVDAYDVMRLVYSRAEADPLSDEEQLDPRLYVL